MSPLSPSEQLVHVYRGHLERVRGLAPRTVRHHATVTTEFLRFLTYDDRPQGLHDLRVAEIEAFVTAVGARVGRITMQSTVAILRSFLRFLAARDQVPLGLDRHIDSPRQYRGERLARALPWDTVLSLLHVIDRSMEKGRRDYAMLLLIATYGLRVSEVAALALDDIMWHARVIRVPRPKIGTPLAVPLTDDVASALLEYVRAHARHRGQRRLCSCACVSREAPLPLRRSMTPLLSGLNARVFVFRRWVVRTASGIRSRCICCGKGRRSKRSATSWAIAPWKAPASIFAFMSKISATSRYRCR